jgi:hypothetical protein
MRFVKSKIQEAEWVMISLTLNVSYDKMVLVL